MTEYKCISVQFSRSVVSDSLRPHGLQPTRLLHPWDFLGKSTGVGCRCLLRPWTARRSNQSILKKSVLNIHWKDWCWSWNSNTLATWCEELTFLKRLWCWERVRAGGEGDNRGWDGWMASPTRWTWVWVNSRSWWWTGRPGVLSLWGCKESDTTERLNCTDNVQSRSFLNSS